MIVPAPGRVQVELLEEDVPYAKAERKYERMGRVVAVPASPGNYPAVGAIIGFDDYAYRRFTLDGTDYCFVRVFESEYEGWWFTKLNDPEGEQM